MNVSIYIIESNYVSLYRQVSFATIDKAKAYREFKHYVDLIKKFPDKDYYANLILVENEHFPHEIASFNKDGLKYQSKEDIKQYCEIDNKCETINVYDALEEIVYLKDDYTQKKLKEIKIFCDDRRVIRAEEDNNNLNLYTTVL